MGHSYSSATQIVSAGPEQMVIRESARGKLLATAVLAVGVGVLFVAWGPIELLPGGEVEGEPGILRTFSSVLSVAGLVIMTLVGGVFALVGGCMLLGRQRITLDRMRRTIHFSSKPEGLEATVDLRRLESIQLLRGRTRDVAGRIGLGLAGRDEPLPVAIRHRERALRADAARLAGFLGLEVVDTRIAAVPIERPGQAQTLSVNTASMGLGGTANYRTHKVVRRGPDVLELRATTMARFMERLTFWVGVIGQAGGVALLVATLSGQTLVYWPALGGVVLLFVWGGVFLLVSRKLLRTRPVIFDASRGEIHGGQLHKHLGSDLTVGFEQILAVQVTSGLVTNTQDGPDFMAYEINLVLDGLAVDRVGLTSHSERDELYSDAEQISTFLGVPLLDHAQADDL